MAASSLTNTTLMEVRFDGAGHVRVDGDGLVNPVHLSELVQSVLGSCVQHLAMKRSHNQTSDLVVSGQVTGCFTEDGS